jgi:protein FAM50
LSFGLDEDEDTKSNVSIPTTTRENTPDGRAGSIGAGSASEKETSIPKKRLGPNSGVKFTPKVMTKSALLREAQTREQLRKEFLAMRDAVKATEILIPFVFYDGTNIPGGVCKVKKGDHVWLFLDKARKVGAELGVGGDKSRREWARVGVDDLMLVRGEIIIPHVSSWPQPW